MITVFEEETIEGWKNSSTLQRNQKQHQQREQYGTYLTMIFITQRNQIRLDWCTIVARSTMEDQLITSYWQVLIWPTSWWESWKGSDKKKLNLLLIFEKIYFKIFVADEHRSLLRILWWIDGDICENILCETLHPRYVLACIWWCLFKSMQQLCANRNSCCEWKWTCYRYQQALWKTASMLMICWN